jgi:hypothetical protein
MLRPQILEAIFVAGSVFVGMTAPVLKWDRLGAVSQREMRFGYEFISAVKSGNGPSLLCEVPLPRGHVGLNGLFKRWHWGDAAALHLGVGQR